MRNVHTANLGGWHDSNSLLPNINMLAKPHCPCISTAECMVIIAQVTGKKNLGAQNGNKSRQLQNMSNSHLTRSFSYDQKELHRLQSKPHGIEMGK